MSARRHYEGRIGRANRERMGVQYAGSLDRDTRASFEVLNHTQANCYDVTVGNDLCTCTCTDWQNHHLRCKHIFKVLLTMFTGVDVQLYVEQMNAAESAHLTQYITMRIDTVRRQSLHERVAPSASQPHVRTAVAAAFVRRTRPTISERRRMHRTIIDSDDEGNDEQKADDGRQRRGRTRRGGLLRRRRRILPDFLEAAAARPGEQSRPEPYRVEGRNFADDTCLCLESVDQECAERSHCYVCGVTMHNKCIDPWIARKWSCPFCRAAWRLE